MFRKKNQNKSFRLNASLLMSLGRSGSTWLMLLLSKHPSIIIDDTYPFENRTAQYWIHMLNVLGGQAEHDDLIDPNTFYFNEKSISKNPFYNSLYGGQEWFEHQYRSRFASFCLDCIDGFYSNLGNVQGKRDPRYFLEKTGPGNSSLRAFRDLYPQGRLFFLLRDFRDVYASVSSFNQKHGLSDFGRSFAGSEHDFIRLLEQSARMLAEAWEATAPFARLVYYEDLVFHPEAVLQELLDFLNLDSSPAVRQGMQQRAGRDLAGIGKHATSPDPAGSVQRWKRELSPDIARFCTEVFAEVLGKFGYAV